MERNNPNINPDAERRLLVQDEIARAAGFSPATPFFALGTRLVEVGQDAFRQSRLAYENKPRAADALDALITTVEAERRVDVDAAVEPGKSPIVMTPDGALHVDSAAWPDEGIRLSLSAFEQLTSRIAGKRGVPNPARFLAAIEPDRRARIVNEELMRIHKDKPVGFRFRTRQVNGHREVFSVVSPSYTPVDAHVLAATIRPAVADNDTRADLFYHGTRTRLELLWHADLAPQDVGVGEFYKAATRLTSDDDGSEGIRLGTDLYRALCVNLTTAVSSKALVYRTHKGAFDPLLDAVRNGVQVSWDVIKRFIATYEECRQAGLWARIEDTLPEGYKPENVYRDQVEVVSDVTRHLFSQPRWSIGGISADEVAAACTEAWLKEPEFTVTGLSQALSRAAHESPLPSPRHEEALQDRAGWLITERRIPWGVQPLVTAP